VAICRQLGPVLHLDHDPATLAALLPHLPRVCQVTARGSTDRASGGGGSGAWPVVAAEKLRV
jgi:hypothetical protein